MPLHVSTRTLKLAVFGAGTGRSPHDLSRFMLPLGFQLEAVKRECSKFVVVMRSERFKSSRKMSTPGRCNYLRNIVVSEIFKTHQNGFLCYESAALTVELRAPRGLTT
jgi:hypothetical protein